MDEDELVIDSPDQSPVEDEDLEDVEESLKLGQPSTAMLPAKPTKDKDGNREQVCYLPVPHLFLHEGMTDRPIISCPFHQYLTYPEALPYECESLQEMDDQLELIIQRLSQAIQARDYDSQSTFLFYRCIYPSPPPFASN